MKKNRKRTNRSLRDLLNRIRRFFMPWVEPSEPAPPEDPYSYRMATLRRPPNRGGAAAVAELDEEEIDEE
jgi:hypothetical protein